jgi:Ca2+/H+ antiporter
MCFFFGGYNRVEQAFNITVAQTAASLLFLAVSSLILPTAFHQFSQAGDAGIKQISRATSVLLLFVYACYIFFQLKTHADMYNAPSVKNKKREMKGAKKTGRKMKEMAIGTFRRKSVSDASILELQTESKSAKKNDQEEEGEPEPQLSLLVAILTLAGSTVLVALNAEYLVDSINAITCSGSGISKTFVGLILLPIVGNAAEHATAVTVAVKDKMDLAIGVAIGSSMQIALLVLPFTVVLGWIIGNEKTDMMTLNFDGFQIAILFVAVLLVNYLIGDGKSHWLEGILLQILYIIIAVAAWYVVHVIYFIPWLANNVLGSTQQRLDRAIAQPNSDSDLQFSYFVLLCLPSAILPAGGELQAYLHPSAYRCKQHGGGFGYGKECVTKKNFIPKLMTWALSFVICFSSRPGKHFSGAGITSGWTLLWLGPLRPTK